MFGGGEVGVRFNAFSVIDKSSVSVELPFEMSRAHIHTQAIAIPLETADGKVDMLSLCLGESCCAEPVSV